MHRTRIKICGITRPEDARLAAEAGADAIGMIFHRPSPRHVTLATARQIVRALPPFVTAVGVFVDATTRDILKVAEALELSHVQLHGREAPEQILKLRELNVIKAMKVEPEGLSRELVRWRKAVRALRLPQLKALVLETGGIRQAGGSGVENDWRAILQTRQSGAFSRLPPMILAGGLHPANVEAVVRKLRPWAVDVSSGVESAPGRKSGQKVRAFIRAVRLSG